MNAAVRFWVRAVVWHTAAHIVATWNGQQVVTQCGNTPAPGGRVLTGEEARRYGVLVCCGCSNQVWGRP